MKTDNKHIYDMIKLFHEEVSEYLYENEEVFGFRSNINNHILLPEFGNWFEITRYNFLDDKQNILAVLDLNLVDLYHEYNYDLLDVVDQQTIQLVSKWHLILRSKQFSTLNKYEYGKLFDYLETLA